MAMKSRACDSLTGSFAADVNGAVLASCEAPYIEGRCAPNLMVRFLRRAGCAPVVPVVGVEVS